MLAMRTTVGMNWTTVKAVPSMPTRRTIVHTRIRNSDQKNGSNGPRPRRISLPKVARRSIARRLKTAPVRAAS